MTLEPQTTLLLCLLAATALGAGAGACLWHLRLAARQGRALAVQRATAERERRALETVLGEERARAAHELAEARSRAAAERDRAERALVHHRALLARNREQERRVEVLEAEVLGLEERQMKLQRDLASDRAGRRHALSLARSTGGRLGEDRLPVLNRRVGAALADSADEVPFPIGSDLDIPPLPESELPESDEATDEMALELFDLREQPGSR